MACYLMQSFIEMKLMIRKKSMERSPFLSSTPESNEGLKTPCQTELNMSFTYTKVSINCFSRNELPSHAWDCGNVYPNEDSTSVQPFLCM